MTALIRQLLSYFNVTALTETTFLQQLWYDNLPVPDLSPVRVHDQSNLFPCPDVHSDPVSDCAFFVDEIETMSLDPSNRADDRMML